VQEPVQPGKEKEVPSIQKHHFNFEGLNSGFHFFSVYIFSQESNFLIDLQIGSRFSLEIGFPLTYSTDNTDNLKSKYSPTSIKQPPSIKRPLSKSQFICQ